MVRLAVLTVVLAGTFVGLSACGPQPKLDDGMNPYGNTAPTAPKPFPTKP